MLAASFPIRTSCAEILPTARSWNAWHVQATSPANIRTSITLESAADELDLVVGKMLDADELLARLVDRAEELVELCLLCDRVLVFHDQDLAATVERDSLDERTLIAAMFGQSERFTPRVSR